MATKDTIEEIEIALKTTAYCMVLNRMPELLPVLQSLIMRLEGKLAEGDALDYADYVLARLGHDPEPFSFEADLRRLNVL